MPEARKAASQKRWFDPVTTLFSVAKNRLADLVKDERIRAEK